MKKLCLAGLVVLLLLSGGHARADAPDNAATQSTPHAGDSTATGLQPDEGTGQTAAAGQEASANAAEQDTDSGIIRLTPDKTKLIHLDEDAGAIIVTNPMHAAVVLDNPRTLVVMPRQPGTTAFSVMNKQGNIIYQRNIVVTAAQDNYVRIRRMCGSGSGSGECVQNAYYYCPDGCYEVTPVQGTPELPRVPQPSVAPAPTGLLDSDTPAATAPGTDGPNPDQPLPDPADDIPVTDEPAPEAQ